MAVGSSLAAAVGLLDGADAVRDVVVLGQQVVGDDRVAVGGVVRGRAGRGPPPITRCTHQIATVESPGHRRTSPDSCDTSPACGTDVPVDEHADTSLPSTGMVQRNETVLVVDFGAQYAQLIARRVRELNVYSEIVPHRITAAEIAADPPAALILSGGPKSVHVEGAPSLDPAIYELGIPILGICYGTQLIAQQLGGEVGRGHARRVRPGQARSRRRADRTAARPAGDTRRVDEPLRRRHSSPRRLHRHCVDGRRAGGRAGERLAQDLGRAVPPGSRPLAARHDRCCSASSTIWPGARRRGRWARSSTRRSPRFGPRSAMHGRSVLSAAASTPRSRRRLVHKAIGHQLTCVYVDTGLMRRGESDQIVETFRRNQGIELIHVDAGERFFDGLAGVTDPETKRKTIGEIVRAGVRGERRRPDRRRVPRAGHAVPRRRRERRHRRHRRR